MDVSTIDHINLRLPPDGVEDAIAFYRDRLWFPIEGLEAYRSGDQSFFDVRLASANVIHLWPTKAFEPPSGNNFNHVALLVDADIEAVKAALADADIPIDMELDAPLGATGRGSAVYVTDPVGYQIELKTTG